MTRELVVAEGAANERLDVFLANQLGMSRSQGAKLLRDEQVQVNGRHERPSYQVQAGDRLQVAQTQHSSVPQVIAPNLPVVYEDDDLLVIDKPAGINTHAGAGQAPGEATIADFARQHTTDPDPERPGIVHRLDRDTSGLLIIAKTPTAKDYLQQAFREHKVQKTYLLLVTGRPAPPEAVIKLPLDRDPAHPLRRAVVASGREAITAYRTLATYPGYSYLEAHPKTGRTHQLRVHFAAIGHPIAGDHTYGSPQRALRLKRHFLHAAGLTFKTPSGNQLDLQSPLPPDLATTLKHLEDIS